MFCFSFSRPMWFTTTLGRWKSRLALMPTLSSLAAPQVIIIWQPAVPPVTTKLAPGRLSLLRGCCIASITRANGPDRCRHNMASPVHIELTGYTNAYIHNKNPLLNTTTTKRKQNCKRIISIAGTVWKIRICSPLCLQGPVLPAWINFNPIDKLLQPLKGMGWNYLPIPKRQRCSRWCWD